MIKLTIAALTACGLFVCAIPIVANAANITFTTTAIEENIWRYEYKLDNAASPYSFDQLSIYFDVALSRALSDPQAPLGWDPLVIQPEPGLASDGIYDVLSISGAAAPGTYTGFSVVFEHFGLAHPGSQRFELVRSSDLSVVFSGMTSPIPEPSAAALLSIGLLALLVRYRRNKDANRFWRARSYIASLLLVGVTMNSHAIEQTPAGIVEFAPPGISIQALRKVSEVRISRTSFEYTYAITLSNNVRTYSSVKVVLRSAGSGTSVTRSIALFGNVAVGTTTGQTISFIHDRTVPFQLAQLRWQVYADPVGALAGLDRSASLLGTDANANGVRDDVDGVIGEMTTDQNLSTAMTQVARALQRAQVPSITQAQVNDIQLQLETTTACLMGKSNDYAKLVNTIVAVTYNTEVRLQALQRYMRLLANRSQPDLPPKGAC